MNPTPLQKLTDAQGRPYFLWDCEMTLVEFESKLKDDDRRVRTYLVAKLMRQAKPDDVFTFVSPQEIANLWPELKGILGKEARFWEWLLGTLEKIGHVRR